MTDPRESNNSTASDTCPAITDALKPYVAPTFQKLSSSETQLGGAVVSDGPGSSS